MPKAELPELEGGDPNENAALARGILAGEPGPRRDIVLLNAGAALCVAGRAPALAEGVAQAAESIDSGNAAHTLKTWAAWSAAEPTG